MLPCDPSEYGEMAVRLDGIVAEEYVMGRDLPFGFARLTPPGIPQPALAIAGSRAGTLGMLNLEFAQDETAAMTALQGLLAYGHGRCGVLLDGEAEALLTSVLAAATASLD